eukprot:6489153-Amphidinium_carterae.2
MTAFEFPTDLMGCGITYNKRKTVVSLHLYLRNHCMSAGTCGCIFHGLDHSVCSNTPRRHPRCPTFSYILVVFLRLREMMSRACLPCSKSMPRSPSSCIE